MMVMSGVRRSAVALTGAAAALALLGGSAAGSPPPSALAIRGRPAVPAPHFAATLTGAQQVPPVRTQATGTARLEVADRGQALAYDIRAVRIKGLIEEHIHLGRRGSNGPVVVSLLTLPTPGVSGSVQIKGYFTAANLTGPLAGHPLNDLISALRQGSTYVNVHTVRHPDGEIRGQL